MKILDNRGSSAKRFLLSFLIPIMALVMFIVAIAQVGLAETVYCDADADSFIAENAPDNNFGSYSLLLVGSDTDLDGSHFAAIIRFDIENCIPQGANIDNAKLMLYRDSSMGSFQMKVSVVKDSWTENTITWNYPDPSLYWNPVTTINPTGATAGVVEIDATQHVKKWVEDGYDNYGFALNCDPYPSRNNNVSFYSKDSGQPSTRCPRIDVTYSLPDDNYEENDTIGTAFHLSSYENTWLSSINGLGIQADDDWYEIFVSSGDRRVLIDCRFTDSQGDIDIALYDSSGDELDDSESSTDNEYIDYTVPESGYYYIKVYYGDAGNTYNLWWDEIQWNSKEP